MTARREGRRLVISSRGGRDRYLTSYGPFQGPPGQPPGPGDGDWQVSRPSKGPDKTPYLIPIPIGLILCLVINLVRACVSTTGPSYPQPRDGIVIESPVDRSNFRLGTQAYFLGEYDRAITYFTMALESEPNVGEIYNRRALAYHEKGEYDRALADYEQALGHQSDPAMVHNNRAVTYSAMGDLDKAMADLGQAIELDASFGKAYYNRGLLHSSQGAYDAAIADLTEALRFPASTSPFSRLLAQRPTSPALDLILGTDEMERELAETGADEPSVRYYRAAAYQAKEEYDNAIEDLDRAIEILSETLPEASPLPLDQESASPGEATAAPQEENRPQDSKVDLPSVYYLRALVYGAKGEYDRAAADLERALQLGLDPALQALTAALLVLPDAALPDRGQSMPGDGLGGSPYQDSEESGANALPAVPTPAATVTTPALPSEFLRLPLDVWTSMQLADIAVAALAIDPLNPSTLYAGTDAGVFKTTDAGRSWIAVNTGLSDLRVAALAVDPKVPSNVYAGTRYRGVCISTDGGAQWSGCSTGGGYRGPNAGGGWSGPPIGPGNGYVLTLAIHPWTPSTLYAGTDGQGVFKSTDSGETWTPAGGDGGGDLYSIWALAIDPKRPSTLYAGDRHGLFRTTNGGHSWQAVHSGLSLDASQVLALAIDPITTTTVYAGTAAESAESCTLFKSSDGGDTWSCIGSDLGSTPVLSLAIDPQTPSTLYAGTGKGVFRSRDSGRTWSEYNDGMDSEYVYTLASNPQTPGIVFAGPSSGGLFVIRQDDSP